MQIEVLDVGERRRLTEGIIKDEDDELPWRELAWRDMR
jgi:hypothetical protein